MIRTIYRLLSLYNDYNAARRGRLPQRIARKEGYKLAGRTLRRLIK